MDAHVPDVSVLIMKIKVLLITLLTSALALICSSCGSPFEEYHAVTFDSNGAEPIQNRIAADGQLISKPENPKKAGYTFIGWFCGDDEWDFENDTVTSDIILKARFDRIVHTVTFINEDSQSVILIHEGDKIFEPIAPGKQNHTFIGWFYGDEKWDFENNTITESITLTAVFEKIAKHTVTFDSNGGSPIDKQTVTDGESAAYAVSEKEHYSLDGWFYGSVRWDFTTPVTESITLKASWVPTEHTVSFNISELITYDPLYTADAQTVTFFDSVSEPAKPSIRPEECGYIFLGWFYGDEKWDFENSKAENDIVLTAKLEKAITVTVTLGKDADGKDFGIEEKYYLLNGELLEEIQRPAYPYPEYSDNWHFKGWYISNTEKWDFNTPVTEDITIFAKWVPMTPILPF